MSCPLPHPLPHPHIDDLEGLLNKLNQFEEKDHAHQSPLGQHVTSRYNQREGHSANDEGEEKGKGLGVPGLSNSSSRQGHTPSDHSPTDHTDGTLSEGTETHLNVTAARGEESNTTSTEHHEAPIRSHDTPIRSQVVLEEALEDAVINVSHDLVDEGRGVSRDLLEEGVACSDVVPSCQMSVKRNTPPRIILQVLDQPHVKNTPPFHMEYTPPFHKGPSDPGHTQIGEATPLPAEVGSATPLPAEVGSATLSKDSATPTQGRTSSATPTDPSPPSVAPPTKQYSDVYRSIEFFPYHPLPSELEALMFPHLTSPLHPIDDPFWPAKAECLDLIGSEHNWPQFTGIFLTPEARGVRYDLTSHVCVCNGCVCCVRVCVLC